MSILKVILHHWNKTTQSYDNFHPETEVSQVTDWNQGIVNTLASTALGGLVNTLTSDSLLAKMIQKVFEATGVKYSLGQNGYVCFGSLVGGLIIQWGRVSGAPNDRFDWDGSHGYEVQVNTNLPIQFKNSALFAVANILTDAENVVDEKAECCNLSQGTLTLKIASSHQGQSLTACYFILGY
jgi:hypothetical protein